MTRRLIWTALAGLALFLILRAPESVAGKPGSTPAPLPPPEQIYVDRRADLGGWLDTRTNLVWGLSIYFATGNPGSYDECVAQVDDYAGLLEDSALAYHQEVLRCETLGAKYAISDPARSEAYYRRADDYSAGAADLDASSLVASQFTNWRMPTKDEAADAIKKGYFTYTPTWGVWDISPLPGLQQQVNYTVHWTSTSDKGGRSQWGFDPASGLVQSYLKSNSILCAVVVRTYVP